MSQPFQTIAQNDEDSDSGDDHDHGSNEGGIDDDDSISSLMMNPNYQCLIFIRMISSPLI